MNEFWKTDAGEFIGIGIACFLIFIGLGGCFNLGEKVLNDGNKGEVKSK